MRKLSKFIAFFAVLMVLFSPFSFAKQAKYKPATIFKFITRTGEKYENRELKEKLAKMKEMKSESKDSDKSEEFYKYDLADSERSVFESCLAWLIIISFGIIIAKIIYGNFKIPFDYDPNFENKHISRKIIRNKKYKF